MVNSDGEVGPQGKTVIEAKEKGIESLLQGVAVLPPPFYVSLVPTEYYVRTIENRNNNTLKPPKNKGKYYARVQCTCIAQYR